MFLLRKHTVSRPHGFTLEEDLDGRMIEHDTLQCCHCGMHWQVKPGSGIKRGFCTLCGAVTCGSAACGVCVPYSVQLGE